MSGITRRRVSASWQRGRESSAPGVSVDVVQPRLVGVPPKRGRESVSPYDDLPDSSHGHPLRRGWGDRRKRCPSALCVTCLCSGEGSQGPSYDSQKPFSSLAEVIEHIPFLLFNLFVYRENSYGKLPLKGNQGECNAHTETGTLACIPVEPVSLLSRCGRRIFGCGVRTVSIQKQRSSASASEVSFERRHMSRRRSRRCSCRGPETVACLVGCHR